MEIATGAFLTATEAQMFLPKCITVTLCSTEVVQLTPLSIRQVKKRDKRDCKPVAC